MATGDRKDPYRGFRFRVEIGGEDKAGFREVSGLDSSTDPIDYREGNEKGATTMHKLSGLNKFSNITLKRGITDDMNLWKWRKDIVDGKQKDCERTYRSSSWISMATMHQGGTSLTHGPPSGLAQHLMRQPMK